MASAIDPSLLIDDNSPNPSTRARHTAWFQSYCSLLSKTIDEHNVKAQVATHIRNKAQKKPCGHAYWQKTYNATATTLHTMKHALDLIATWKHKAKVQPLLQKLLTKFPEQATSLRTPSTPEEALSLYDKIRSLRKTIAIPLQKRNRELAYSISKKNRELTQTITPEGKNLKRLLKTVKAHSAGIFTLGGVFIQDTNGNPIWSTKPADIEKAMIQDMKTIFDSQVPSPVTPEQRRV